jgi:hypothetical protein
VFELESRRPDVSPEAGSAKTLGSHFAAFT